MDTAGLRSAYENLLSWVAPAADGRGDGWPADLVLAHVAVNDGLLAATTEDVLAGRAASYDNASAVADDVLREWVYRAAGTGGVTQGVRQAGERLISLVAQLDDDQSATVVPVRIRDGQDVIVDSPMPWGRALEVHARVHLVSHAEQLADLTR